LPTRRAMPPAAGEAMREEHHRSRRVASSVGGCRQRGERHMRTALTTGGALLGAAALLCGALVPIARGEDAPVARKSPGGFPAPDEIQRLYDEADLNRAIQAYRFFY